MSAGRSGPKVTGSTPPPSIPLIDLQAQYRLLQPRIEARIEKVLAEGRFILGPEVAELEEALARFTGARSAVSVASGTDALKIALLSEGIGPGDAVFVPAFTFVATAEAVADLGATPVFVDIDPVHFNMDPRDLTERVESVAREGRLRPRAVIPVDLFGLPADIGAIAAIAEPRGMFLLADAAQSLGARLHDRRVGSLAPVTATSFYPSKPLACFGDGGCIFTDDPKRAAVMRSLRGHGFDQDGRTVERLGMNSRLDTLQAAVLLTKLEVFEEELAARARIAGWYRAGLPRQATAPVVPEHAASAWSVYSILVDGRDAVRESLTADGIATAIYYPLPLHEQPAYAAFGEGPGSRPVSEAVSRRILALPMHPYLDEATVERICQSVARALS